MTTTANQTVVTETKERFSFLSLMQNIGKSLVFPIATLPAAALLLRIGVFINSYGAMDGNGWEQFLYWVGFIMQTPGAAVFDNMPIIFGIGVAFGFAKENRGEVALVGAIAYFALIGLAQNENSLSTLIYGNVNLGNGATLPDGTYHSDLLYLNVFLADGTLASSSWLMNFGVFGGILTGLTTAVIYNKFADTRLHPALGFFSGRRFVPIITLFIMMGVSFGMAIVWPWINIALIQTSILIAKVPWLGAGLYGFANRLLIPFGLHQVLNTYFWFQSPVVANLETIGGTGTAQILLGAVDQTAGTIKWNPVQGDINAFADITSGSLWQINGVVYQLSFDSLGTHATFLEGTIGPDGTTFTANAGAANEIQLLQSANIGMYQAGFYPTMMFGLPAVAIAMAIRAEDEYKKQVWAFMIAGSVVAFLTGITEPLEFAFMFISPVIYVVYSALTGVYASLVVLLGISNGFGFSAGFIDWFISFLGGGIGVLSSAGNWANLELLVIGAIAAAVNFTVVYFLIEKLNIATPGRNGNVAGLSGNDDDGASSTGAKASKNEKLVKMAKGTIDFIGVENIKKIDNCITRVRLTVVDNSVYDDSGAVAIGYTGVIKVGKQAYQMIIGPESEVIANEMRRLISEGYGSTPTESKEEKPKPATKPATKPAAKKTTTSSKPAAKKPAAKSTAKK